MAPLSSHYEHAKDKTRENNVMVMMDDNIVHGNRDEYQPRLK